MSEPQAIITAIQRLKPMCPNCGREATLPRLELSSGRAKLFNELNDCERTRQHVVTCHGHSCGITYAARFYEAQK